MVLDGGRAQCCDARCECTDMQPHQMMQQGLYATGGWHMHILTGRELPMPITRRIKSLIDPPIDNLTARELSCLGQKSESRKHDDAVCTSPPTGAQP